MRLGLVIYGNLDTVTGGFLYDKLVTAYFRPQGDEVEIISLPWHPYGLSFCHNLWPSLKSRLVQGHFDAVIQDELVHPSLFWLNQRLKSHHKFPDNQSRAFAAVHRGEAGLAKPVLPLGGASLFAVNRWFYFYQQPHQAIGANFGWRGPSLLPLLIRRGIVWGQ